jgi:hypothetical protein
MSFSGGTLDDRHIYDITYLIGDIYFVVGGESRFYRFDVDWNG